MINQQRRTMLKSISLLAALPVAGFSSISAVQGVISDTAVELPAITLTNLSPKTLTLNEITAVGSPDSDNTVQFKLKMAKTDCATLQPGAQMTFNVVACGDTDEHISQIKIKSDHPEFDGFIPVYGGNAQITMI